MITSMNLESRNSRSVQRKIWIEKKKLEEFDNVPQLVTFDWPCHSRTAKLDNNYIGRMSVVTASGLLDADSPWTRTTSVLMVAGNDREREQEREEGETTYFAFLFFSLSLARALSRSRFSINGDEEKEEEKRKWKTRLYHRLSFSIFLSYASFDIVVVCSSLTMMTNIVWESSSKRMGDEKPFFFFFSFSFFCLL